MLFRIVKLAKSWILIGIITFGYRLTSGDKMRISVVSYLNSAPLVYGILHSGYLDECTVTLDVPAVGADKLARGETDLALVPVGAFPGKNSVSWVGDYCIGVEGPVRTVCLFSEVPVEKIRTVWLDNQSRTSVRLIQILARHYWKINWSYRPATDGFETRDIHGDQAAVCIGDKVFAVENRYAFRYDLAECWIRLTGLPFVFAAFAARIQPAGELLDRLNRALEAGISAMPDIAGDYVAATGLNREEILDYWTRNISYPLTDRKREGMELFHAYVNKKEDR